MILRNYKEKIKLFLVFFCFLGLSNCNDPISIRHVKVSYEEEKAIAVAFYWESTLDNFGVYLKGEKETPILGIFTSENNIHTFKPIIPFSSRQHYLIRYEITPMAKFYIDEVKKEEAPRLVSIYPTTDTVPENLLKVYLLFSKPMQEVNSSMDFISVINNATGKKVNVFLPLTTELWNAKHTQLTLWLDPGRIKTDLIPNREKGLPIVNGNQYTLEIDSIWKDARGSPLVKSYEKKFTVGFRDNQKPLVNKWKLAVKPTVLEIDFSEPLDAILINKVFSIHNSKGNLITGTYRLHNEERGLQFIPSTPFEKGNYSVTIESRLEDLAGNNLNRLFDTDLSKVTDQDNSETKTLHFKIE